MFKSIKRLLIAATAILAISAPSAAYAFVRPAAAGSPTGSTPAVARADVIALKPQAQAAFHRLDAQATRQRSIASAVPRAAAPASEGFQWGDAGIGAAGVLALVGVGSGGLMMIRRRVHQPLAS
jgi:hypothetical protein